MSEKELRALITRLSIELDKIKKDEENNKRINSSRKRQITNDIVNLENQLHSNFC